MVGVQGRFGTEDQGLCPRMCLMQLLNQCLPCFIALRLLCVQFRPVSLVDAYSTSD